MVQIEIIWWHVDGELHLDIVNWNENALIIDNILCDEFDSVYGLYKKFYSIKRPNYMGNMNIS